FYETGELGRYVGGGDKAVIDEELLVNGVLAYNCAYLVNIFKEDGWLCDFTPTCTDDCISNCIGPNCEGYCDGVDCISECINLGCIYNADAGSSLLTKPVSLNQLFPNGTKSYNWDKSRNKKAETTIDEIEGAENTIYDTTPDFSVTIDGTTAAAIEKYNKCAEGKPFAAGVCGDANEGGYSNKTLECHDLNGYEDVACYSSFITDLIEGKYGNNIVNYSATKNDRNVGDNNTSYFTPWKGTISEADMIGPSWK
ncbi:MAG: hypothetical protein K2J20_04140, partial [Bacilli bacterium]|nr:hypothetical protein [Bacilli bacterium]